MRHSKIKSKNRRFSKFLGQRRKSVFQKKEQNFSFVKQNQGSISTYTIYPGIFKCFFSSKATGRTAFAFGATWEDAYSNMISKFNLKYS